MTNEHVQVLYDYIYYTEEGKEIKIQAGEELRLLKKSNDDWWQVIRSSEEEPFYAPSNYLSITYNVIEQSDSNANFETFAIRRRNNQNSFRGKSKYVESEVKDMKIENFASEGLPNRITGALSFRNPLCSDIGSLSLFDSCDKELERNTEGSYCRSMKAEDDFTSEDILAPIYINIPSSIGRSPPTPDGNNNPLRSLPNGWYEYFDDESARKYYFHAPSGKTTWKPPRRHENFQSTPISSKQNSPKFTDTSIIVPEPPPKQLKPKLKKLAHSSNESLDSPTSLCMFTILPPGWSQECNLDTGSVYYSNTASNKKWYSSLDENGRTYFYEEDSSESVWELPEIAAASDNEEIRKPDDSFCTSCSSDKSFQNLSGHSKINESSSSTSPRLRSVIPKLPASRQFKTRSLIVPECVNLASCEDNKGFLPASFGEGYWPSVQDGHFSITRKGTLNKTKLVEGGRRVRKNWTTSFVVLTDVFLLFYKDIRSAHLATPGMKPELCIDLNGALIEWSPEKSSRKNVFQISTVLGHQLLLQDDNAQTTKEWFDTIQAAIMVLPSSSGQSGKTSPLTERDEPGKKDVKLLRSKSTKYYSANKNGTTDDSSSVVIPPEKKRKIRDKLRQFFVRRPTLESLREKGILLDEPVFGCHLENLCNIENTNIPKFVVKCISIIEKKELTADGLYRASGNLSQVQKIRIHVNQDDYSCLENEEDVHVLTGALKMFFREMKEPLFPFNTFHKFLGAIALPDASSKLKVLKELVSKLPSPNYSTLKFLLTHLLRVTEFHKQNRMQIQNLAIVFGPTLMWPEQVSSNIALDMMHQNRIVEFLLLEFDIIFDQSNSSKVDPSA